MAADKRAYDSRVRESIARTGNAHLFPELDIPRGTRDAWVRRGPRNVIGLDAEIGVRARLLDRLNRLERRVRILTALVRLLRAVLRISAFQLDLERLPAGKHKLALLSGIEKSSNWPRMSICHAEMSS